MSLRNAIWHILETRNEDPFQDLSLKRPEILKNLEPTYEDLYDPFLLKNMDLAVQRILQAFEKNEKILIHGDYDVDGIISTLVMYEGLLEIRNQSSEIRNISQKHVTQTSEIDAHNSKRSDFRFQISDLITVFLPHRIDDGYGLNMKNLPKFKEQGIDLIITVDNGISAVEEIAEAKRLGMDVLVTDHHNAPEILPNTLIINPKQPECNYPFKGLVGAGVAYKLIQALYKASQIETNSSTFMHEILGLVSLATVVDCGDLIDENRTFVALGLRELQRTRRPSLNALYKVMEIDPANIGTYTLGFQIGPRLNASGRIDTPMLGFDFLREQDPNMALEKAKELNALNIERQDILAIALEEAEQSMIAEHNIIICKNPDWHIGVIGLIAGKLSEKYHKPCFALTLRDHELVGSIRNPLYDIDITTFLNDHPELFAHFGGHKQAAGFSLPTENWEKFVTAMQKSADKYILPEYLQKTFIIDHEMKKATNFDEVTRIKKLAPFGLGNREPRFLLSCCDIMNPQSFGKEQEHFKCMILFQGQSIEAVAFREPEWKKSFDQWKQADILGKISIQEWNGKKKLQIIVEDARDSSK